MLNHRVHLNHDRSNRARKFYLTISFFMTVSVMLLLSPFVKAAEGEFSLGGFSEIVNNSSDPQHPKAFQVPSTCYSDCLTGKSGGILTTSSVIYLPTTTLRLKDLHTLSTDYRRWDGDCGGGSPRFEIALDKNGDGTIDGRVFVYLGELYSFTNCNRSWENTGNFISQGGDSRWDFAQLGGQFYSSYRETISGLGDAIISYIILVVDGSWYPYIIAPFGQTYKQIFQVDRVRVNNDVYNASNAPSITRPQGPTITALNLEQYMTGLSAPRNVFGAESYLGRRYSVRTLLRMLGQSRTSASRSSR